MIKRLLLSATMALALAGTMTACSEVNLITGNDDAIGDTTTKTDTETKTETTTTTEAAQ